MSKDTPQIPYRQIRALFDDSTITVYQAYPASIAIPAVAQQKLSASPDFLFGRMTWIKPSWMWMMYRSGYSYKDPRQAHILALKMKRVDFERLLSLASLSPSSSGTGETEKKDVRAQWDPERSVALGKLSYRSIQIGVGRKTSKEWVESMIVGIEDVTARAQEMKALVDAGQLEEARSLIPEEREYVLSSDLRESLGMDKTE